MENRQSGTSDKVYSAVKCEICLCTFVVAVKQPLCDSWAPGTDAMLFLRNDVLPACEMAVLFQGRQPGWRQILRLLCETDG